MHTISIIGGTGFIGDYLSKNLSERKEVKLKIVYRNTKPEKKLPHVEYLQITDDDPNSVISFTDFLIILSRPNKKLIQNIINSELKFKKIIYASTLLIYPNSKAKQNETSELEPVNEYERNKIDEEKMLKDFANKSNIQLTIARLTNVYGDKKNRALVHWLISALVSNTVFKLNNNGRPIRDFIFVEDVAKYLELLIFLPQENLVEIFNICTGVGFNINQVVSISEKISGKKVKIIKGDLTDEKMSVIGDNKKIINATGFSPKYDLESGLKKAYQNYLS